MFCFSLEFCVHAILVKERLKNIMCRVVKSYNLGMGTEVWVEYLFGHTVDTGMNTA